MNNINYSIIDRITALRYELQENTNNEIRIITGVRNILYDVDEMTMNDIRSHLIYYYNNIYQNNVITLDVINYITQTNISSYSTVNSINSLLNIWANMNNPPSGMNTILEENNISADSDDETGDSDDETGDSDDEISLTNSSDTNTNINTNINTGQVNHSDFRNNLIANMLNSYNNLGNLSVPNLNNINNLENLSVPNFNNINNLENLSVPNFNNINNLENISLPNFNNVDNLINYNEINNIFGNLVNSSYTINEINSSMNLNMNTVPLSNFFSTLNNTSINEDVPLVIKLDSLEKLEVNKFMNLTEELKDKNKKCMIKLEDFNEEDIVRVLPCKHVFSKDLIDDWLRNSSYKCPICRKASGEYYAKFS